VILVPASGQDRLVPAPPRAFHQGGAPVLVPVACASPALTWRVTSCVAETGSIPESELKLKSMDVMHVELRDLERDVPRQTLSGQRQRCGVLPVADDTLQQYSKAPQKGPVSMPAEVGTGALSRPCLSAPRNTSGTRTKCWERSREGSSRSAHHAIASSQASAQRASARFS